MQSVGRVSYKSVSISTAEDERSDAVEANKEDVFLANLMREIVLEL